MNVMRLFDRTGDAGRNKECLRIFRGFLEASEASLRSFDYPKGLSKSRTDVAVLVEFAKRLNRNQHELVRFLEMDMDLLTADERYRLYPHLPGFFGKHLARILAARLEREEDERCLERLHQVAALRLDEASRNRSANRCQAFVQAAALLREHDAAKPESDRASRLRDLHRISLAHAEEDGINATDLLVIFALGTKPKDGCFFLSFIGAVSDAQILSQTHTFDSIVEGLSLFGDKERAGKLFRMKGANQDVS